MRKIIYCIIAVLASSVVKAQAVGSKVAFKSVSGKSYTGTVKAIQGNKYKISYDGYNYEAWMAGNQFTLLDAAPSDPEPSQQGAVPTKYAGGVTVDADNTLSADRPLISCPIQQPTVKNGAKPNIELFKQLVQCSKGERPARKGLDGAITIDVNNIQVGTPHKWDIIQDRGNATPQTIVYPVKVTYTLKQFYRTRTDVWENWVVIMNFYVNAFGEWAIGANQLVRTADHKDIPR